MSNLRLGIESLFEKLARLIFKNRIKILLITVAITALLLSQLPKITIDTSTEGFLHARDPALITYEAFREQFGRDEMIIIAVEPPDVFALPFLKKLKRLHEALETQVPYLEDITSLINARNTRGAADELIVEELMENWPKTDDEMNKIKKRALSNKMYRNMLISEDARFTTIVIQTQSFSSEGQQEDIMEGFDDEGAEDPKRSERELLSDKENSMAVLAARRIAKEFSGPDFKVFIAGSPVVTHILKQSMMGDMRKFLGLAALAVALLLFLMFRRISGVLMPLGVVLLSLATTIALMAITGTPIKVPTQILPSFLLAVGVGSSVHILAIFFHKFDRSGKKETSIAHAMGHSGLAILMTNVTTASGLLSFATAEVAPIADLGIFAGCGVLITFIYTLILLPALLAIVPLKPRTTQGGPEKPPLMDRILTATAGFSCNHPVKILLVTGAVVIVAMFFITRISFSHHILHWFPPQKEIRVATEKIDHELNGSISMEILLDTGKENGLYDPDFLKRLDRAAAEMEKVTFGDLFVGKAWCLTTILKEIHQALNENRQAFYAISDNPRLIAQEFLLFENSGSDDLEDFVDSQFSKARFTMKVPFKDAVKYGPLLDQTRSYFNKNFPDVKIEFSGMMFLLATTISNAIHSMAKSYIIALGVITLLMILLIGRVRIGLLSMIPNLTPILLMLGIIGGTALPLDLFTMMVASIAIGLAVDDTIHFMHNFRRFYELSGDPEKAVHETLLSTGRAMLVTTVVLSTGFFIYTFASMQNIVNFGILTSFTVTVALMADYLVAPALMILVNKKKIAA
jgi:uncharacterized protein